MFVFIRNPTNHIFSKLNFSLKAKTGHRSSFTHLLILHFADKINILELLWKIGKPKILVLVYRKHDISLKWHQVTHTGRKRRPMILASIHTSIETIIDLNFITKNFYFVLFAIAADVLNEARASKSSWLKFWMIESRDTIWKRKTVLHKIQLCFCGAFVNPYKAQGFCNTNNKWIP